MRVAVLGIGAMGSRIAASLLTAGHAISIWNRTADRAAPLAAQGARLAGTPAEAAQDAEVVLAMVRDDMASRRVWLAPDDGVLASADPQALAIDCSTLSVGWARELSAACAARGMGFLDAPVVGSRAQAEARTLIHLVGGEVGSFARAAPIFNATGRAAHHVGPAGAGAALKLLVNAALGTQVALMAELLAAAERFGLDPARAMEVAAETPAFSPTAVAAARAMLARSFEPAFPVDLIRKDLDYLLCAAVEDRAPVATATRDVFARAASAGLGALNMTAVAKLYA